MTESEGNPQQQPLLFLVEGQYDMSFLNLLSRQLHSSDPQIPDLPALQTAGKLLFFPAGGNPQFWTDRLAPLGCFEFHLYDRESERESPRRQEAAAVVNARAKGSAWVTSKRSLENYLHPKAIEAAGRGVFEFGDFEDVGALVARDWYERSPQKLAWRELSSRSRSRLIQRAKKWLNTTAVEAMTADLLDHRDPAQELRAILKSVGKLAVASDSR